MPEEVFKHTKKKCKKNSKIGLLATEGTLKTEIYNKLFKKDFKIIIPTESLQTKSVNQTIKYEKPTALFNYFIKLIYCFCK